MPSFKIAILEKDGVDLDISTEYDPEIMLPELGFLKDGLTANAGWSCTVVNQEMEIKTGRIAFTTKYEKQAGFIKHNGFIKGSA